MARPRKQRVDASVALQVATPARHELWVGVADALRSAILDGSIAAGSSLVEADLAERFEVSRGPIRDALRDLAREGLVVDLPRRGSVVSTLSFTDIQEVYEVREGLEAAAVKLVVARAADQEIAELADLLGDLEAAWDRGDEYAESLSADLAFHSRLVSLAGNGRMTATYEQLVGQTRLQAISAAVVNPSLRLGMKRSAHRDIVQCLLTRDPLATVAAIERHYAYARERLLIGDVGS